MAGRGTTCFKFAYYCSGHGYGHATRVSAFASHLLSLDPPPVLHIVSSAPKHVFSDSVALGALYRYSEIDPVIIQPLAYCVDRRKSIDVLKGFLSQKDIKLEEERTWLIDTQADCVLSDAAFLGCLAANAAGLPSILITNFTFDSVYSYLSTSLIDTLASPELEHLKPVGGQRHGLEDLIPDTPIPLSDLAPLVDQIFAGYRCADLLLLLPGFIPIPSFFDYPALPSPDWVDPKVNKFRPEIISCLDQLPSSCKFRFSVPTHTSTNGSAGLEPAFVKRLEPNLMPRTILPAPLIVRPPTAIPSVYTSSGRAHLLSSIGIHPNLHDPDKTKILVVSFGGQVFRKPSRSGSKSPNKGPSLQTTTNGLGIRMNGSESSYLVNVLLDGVSQSLAKPANTASNQSLEPKTSLRLATSSHIWIPGAPPASKPLNTPTSPRSPLFATIPTLSTIPPTPNTEFFEFELEDTGPRLLPDSSWIAIVCGVSKQQWNRDSGDSDSDLPEGFFVAPLDVYMPDLTVVGDVLLGKLGYGTVAECIDSCTPFVYVSRPLFIEEHGLRLLLDREGVGVELPREAYEAGNWAGAVEDVWMAGRETKARKRAEGAIGVGLEKRAEEGKEMAQKVVDWVQTWWDGGSCRK